MKGIGKVATFWLLGENCQDIVDGDGDGDQDEFFDQLASDGDGDNLEEMSFPTKVTFCVSDHDDEAHAAKSRIIDNNPIDVKEGYVHEKQHFL